jgi:hypothetical protein
MEVHESIQSRILGNACRIYLVMAGLVPALHDFSAAVP